MRIWILALFCLIAAIAIVSADKGNQGETPKRIVMRRNNKKDNQNNNANPRPRKIRKQIKKCPGKCVKKNACEGDRKGKRDCKGGKICCVSKASGATVKRFCTPLSPCSELSGECRKKKTGCQDDEKTFTSSKSIDYCDKKGCVCCVKECAAKNKCSKKGGFCVPKKYKCSGTVFKGKKYCRGNGKCKCCVLPEQCKPKRTCVKAGGTCVDRASGECEGEIKITNSKGKTYCKGDSCGCCLPVIPDWSYSGETGPGNWSSTYPTCGDSSQSPIDIDTSATIGDFPWKLLGLQDYDTSTQELKLRNNARHAQLTAEGPYIQGGNLALNEQFPLAAIFFHWGPDDSTGSEHTIDGDFYAGEVQFVHYNSKYGSLADALGQADSVVILTSFLDISESDNEELTPLISGLENVETAFSSATVSSFDVRNLLPETYNDFYRYDGSLPIPDCSQNATWLIAKDPVEISSSQMATFRTLLDENEEPIITNSRPVQELNGRQVSAGQLEPSWSHDGPDGQDVWVTEISETCGGQKQSPIDIITSATVSAPGEPLVLTNFELTPDSMFIENNDNGANLYPTMDYTATLVGGPFLTPYTFYHYHFHFGSATTQGSEHTVDGKRYDGEIHMLAFNETLGGLGPAFPVENGIYEICIFMELSETDNPKLANVITAFENIILSGSRSDVTPFPLENFLPENLQSFYYYDGAFTAPVPICSELVGMFVFADPIPISRAQLDKLYNIENAAGNKIQNNFRDLQPLNGRTVFSSP